MAKQLFSIATEREVSLLPTVGKRLLQRMTISTGGRVIETVYLDSDDPPDVSRLVARTTREKLPPPNDVKGVPANLR